MDDTTDLRPSTAINDIAIRGLIKSCRAQAPNGSNCQSQSLRFIDIQHACDELLSFSFHSEDGKLQLIENLTTLDGNFVVKIIRKGLVSLSQVYSDSKTFEQECLKLVDLCCSQSKSLKNGSGPHLASPAVIIDWAVALCDELKKAEEVSSRSSAVPTSRCLSKLRDIHETIVRGRMTLISKSALETVPLAIETVKVLFETLLPRIQGEEFEELIEQTVAIIKTEENLDFLKFSRLSTFKQAFVLSCWLDLLKLSLLPNWFLVEVAKHDFLVHDDSYAQSLPFSDSMTYTESLVCQVSIGISSITSSVVEKKEGFCSEDKTKVFFEYSEIFLRHTSLCLQLMKSKEISVIFIEKLFFELGIHFDRALLPVPAKSELEDCCFEISPDIDAMTARMKSVLEENKKRAENKLMVGGAYKNSSFEVLTKALLTLPDNQQVLSIVQLWKQNFPDDKSHLMLSQLLGLVEVVMEGDKESISKNMEHLVEFLSHLATECLRNLSLWQPTMVHLIPALPYTWFGPEVIAFIQSFTNLANRANDRSTGNIENIRQIPNFVLNLKGSSKSEDVKTKALKLGLDLLEQVPHQEEYKFILNVILSVASDMETDVIKTFTLSLLETARVHVKRIRYLEIWRVISLIDLSRSIRHKSEVFESYLKFLREINHDGILDAVITCRSFLQLPIAVDTGNVIRFLVLAATDEGLKTCQFIRKCLLCSQQLLTESSCVDEHVIFLISVVENMPCARSRGLFFESAHKYMELQMLSFPSIDIFEIILASIAGCIAVGKFASNRFGEVLRVVQAAFRTNRMNKPNASDVLSLFIHVAKTIDKAQSFGKKKDFADLFSRALCPIATLPLILTHKVELMDKVTSILKDEKITDNQKLFNVMFHLFQLPSNEAASSVDSEALDVHFKEVVETRVIRNVAEIPLMQKNDPNAGSVSFFSLMEALVERMPETFANKTSSSLYRFIIERVEENPKLSCSIFPIVEAITKRPVSEAKLKEEIEEIEEVLLPLPPEFMFLIGECLRECYTAGLSHEEQSIKCLIVQIIECLRLSELNVDDGVRMMNSKMEIPKLLVLTFKEATTTEEARENMTRIFDVVKSLDSEFIAGNFLFWFAPRVNEQFRKIVSQDFFMLLKHKSLTATDLCTAMLVYQNLELEGLLNVFDLSLNQDFASVFQQWFSGISQSEIPTPGNLAYIVMQQLRRIKIQDDDIQGTTIEICCTILGNRCFNFRRMPTIGISDSPPPKQYLDMIISLLKESSHLTEIRHWLKTDCLMAVQCKNVIRAACSWRAGRKNCEEAMSVNTAVSETLSSLISKKVPPLALSSLGTILAKELEVMVLAMQTQEDKDIAVKLFELLCTNTQCAEACIDVVRSWSKEQSLLIINKIADWYEEKRQGEVILEQLNNEIRIPLQVLSFAANAFPNSAEEVFNFLAKTTEVTGPEDHTSLGRLPLWYKQMIDAGFESQAIQSWCTSFVLAQNSCSSDVDSLANLTPEMINVLTAEPEANQITQSLFCLRATQHLQNDKKVFKRCLVLARLLNEFACILEHLKENVQVVQRIQQGVGELCSTFLDDSNTMGILYKIRYKILEDLFVLLFRGEMGEHEASLRQLTSEGRFSKSLVIIFRRLARSVVSRPITFGHIKSVVTTMLRHKAENPDCQDQNLQHAVHLKVLHFESNQDAIHTLQAEGYNQSTSANEDLWYSSSIQMPAYVPTVRSFESSRKECLLRQLWREWKTLLTVHDISEVEVSGQILKQNNLFKMSDSLEAMEAQLKSVQQAIQAKPLKQNGWSFYRQKELLRNEKRLRDKIAMQVEEVEEMTGTRWAKMVIVWENQLLESVKMCSEKIPDCYAPNGFHSEKPVICGIAVDNRILAVYKEDQGGTRTEVENVEVKLYPAGMVVFGMYRSIHPNDTEQLWAAFYKMLLDKRLVPKIFITNVSPAFDWIKQFIAPEVSSSRGINFISCCNLVPSSEDSFDYNPEKHLLAVHAALASSQSKELIILTPEKAAELQIRSIKAPVANRKLLMKEHIHRVSRRLEENRRLQEMHPEPQDHNKILKRLRTPITKAVEAIVNGDEPTQKSISRSIDMRRLLPHQEATRYNNDDYSAVILDAVNTVTRDLRGTNTCYDGCQHVMFSQ